MSVHTNTLSQLPPPLIHAQTWVNTTDDDEEPKSDSILGSASSLCQKCAPRYRPPADLRYGRENIGLSYSSLVEVSIHTYSFSLTYLTHRVCERECVCARACVRVCVYAHARVFLWMCASLRCIRGLVDTLLNAYTWVSCIGLYFSHTGPFSIKRDLHTLIKETTYTGTRWRAAKKLA